MAWAVGLPFDTTKVRFIPGIIRDNNAALQTVVSASSLAVPVAYVPDSHPVYFYANTNPVGWTLLAAPADCLLALKGGVSAYNVAGGALVGTWVGPGYGLLYTDLPNTGGPASPVALYVGSVPTTHLITTVHHHDWSTTRPAAALGVLCTKNP